MGAPAQGGEASLTVLPRDYIAPPAGSPKGRGNPYATMASPAPTQGQFAPVTPVAGGGFSPMSPYQQASAAQSGALGRTAMGLGETAAQGMGLYQNPYESQVVEQTLRDVGGAARVGLNELGAQATQSRAFGGSRHGVAEAEALKGFQQQALDKVAQLRAQGFNTALGASQADIASQLGAAQQLAGLGGQSFGYGQAIQQQQSAQGLLQRGIQQALIDAAQRQYAGFTGAPQAAMQLPLQALGQTPTPQTTTSSSNPGLFDYLTTAATIGSLSDIRLKENVQLVENIGGVQFYKWTWNDIGERLKSDGQPSFGVIADELKETHPHLVKRGKDGYLRVNYHGLKDELEAA